MKFFEHTQSGKRYPVVQWDEEAGVVILKGDHAGYHEQRGG